MEQAKKAVIKHSKGLHTRVAAMVVQKFQEVQQKYQVALFLHYKGREKMVVHSLMPLVALRIKAGDVVGVSGSGSQAEAAVNEMVAFLESDFDIQDHEMINQVDNVLQSNAFTAEEVFRSMANGLIAVDENNIVTVFNPAAERIMGLKAAAVIGRPVHEVVRDSRLHIVNKSRQSELGCRQDINGKILITNRTPIIVDNQPKGAVAIFEDVSSLEQITGELRQVKELKESLHLVLEFVQDGICVMNKDGYITYVNPAYLRITRQTPEELIGHSVAALSPFGARNRALVSRQKVLGNITKKANGVTIVSNVNPIVIDGEMMGAVSVIKNISEVQAVMEQLNELAARAEYFEQELRRAKKTHKAFDNFIGRSGVVVEALAIASKASQVISNVLIQGESGTGKELVAEGIHYAGKRANQPFIRVNCAAIPSSLLESELFGHEKGAFTGALKKKLGLFELAHQGTIFLDEIGEMEKSMQVKLLRVLQQREFQRVGGETVIKVDVRIIAATNRDLDAMVKTGEFREDLYYRLNVIPIFLPPLRQRKEDLPLLIEHFIHKISREQEKAVKGIGRDAMSALLKYHWPGNVREVENVLERMMTLAEGQHIGIADLPLYLREEMVPANSVSLAGALPEAILPWQEYEKRIIKAALEVYGSFNAAGKALGLTHRTVALKAQKYGLSRSNGLIKKNDIDKKYQQI